VGNVELFSSLLGLTDSWEVTSVDFKPELSRVEIRLSHVGVLTCSACGEACAMYDQSDERWWRHLNTMEHSTFVIARIPRSNCPTHGIKQVDVPWAGPKSRFTFGMEEWAIEVLQLTKSQARTARLLRLSAGQVHDIMHRAVKRGLERRKLDVIPHLGIDEKSFQRRDFATILCDLTGKRVLEVERGHKEESARKAFAVLPYRGMVKTVCMDMSEAYKKAASSGMGVAEIVHDRFHVAALLSQAVDETRRAEVKKRPELKESRYVWLKSLRVQAGLQVVLRTGITGRGNGILHRLVRRSPEKKPAANEEMRPYAPHQHQRPTSGRQVETHQRLRRVHQCIHSGA